MENTHHKVGNMSIIKLSLYNFNMGNDINGRSLICNLRTLSVAWFELDELKRIKEGFYDENDDKAKEYLKHGFCVIDTVDERELVKKERRKFIENNKTKHMHYVIAPTLLCNYNCLYCFQRDVDKKTSMSLDDAEKVVLFIHNNIKSNERCKFLDISFFGGEPTLKKEIVLNIGSRLKDICIENNITLKTSITTNGYLLSRELVTSLVEHCNLKECQITIDGFEETYSSIKQVPNEYFTVVINNIAQIHDIISVTVRINAVPGKETEIIRLVRYLLQEKELDEKIKLYIAPVQDYNANCIDTLYSDKDYLSLCEYLDKELGQYNLHYYYQNGTPTMKLAFCGALKRIFSCIGPDLNLYRCEHYLGRTEFTIGNVETGYNYNNRFDNRFLDDLPEKCILCNFVPVCQGGCMANRLLDNIEPDCANMRNRVWHQINNLLIANRKEKEMELVYEPIVTEDVVYYGVDTCDNCDSPSDCGGGCRGNDQ